jgi:hypothetical protein
MAELMKFLTKMMTPRAGVPGLTRPAPIPKLAAATMEIEPLSDGSNLFWLLVGLALFVLATAINLGHAGA